MTSSIVHLSDPHFGHLADPAQIGAIEELIPDLEPGIMVISGDLTQRARHGEYLAVKGLIRQLERSAPVVLIPGNHDVQWWLRPLVPFGSAAKYRKYVTYFGPVLSPTVSRPDCVLASVLTAHGLAWGSLTLNPRDLAVKGHLPSKEMQRVKTLFDQATPEQLRVLLIHHNVLRGELSQRMGLARWKQAQQRIVASGAEVVLCGHDHQEQAELLEGKVVVSCAGTLSIRSRGERPATFHRLSWDEDSVQLEQYRWEGERKLFKRADVYAFARVARPREATARAS